MFWEPRQCWWRHVIINTKGSWLPGDERGFRSRNHKIHSSGDYTNPPPRGEHEGLFAYSKRVCPHAVLIPPDARSVVGLIVIAQLQMLQLPLLTLAVGGHHVHYLARLPNDDAAQWDIVGRCKRVASHAIRDILPGTVWAQRGRIKRIRDKQHHRNTYQYVLDHADEGAWTWNYQQGVVFDPSA